MNSQKHVTHSEMEAVVARAHERATGATLGDIKINVLIKHTNLLLLDLLGKGVAPYDLSCVGYIVLIMLYSTPENLANPSDLCVATGETRGNMTRICDDLVDKGFILRVTNPEDRRRVDISLTEKGTALLDTVVPVLRKRAESNFSIFNDDEKNVLISLLSRLNQSLESKL
jgi:MarR family transcriptional repressor of emrRAB